MLHAIILAAICFQTNPGLGPYAELGLNADQAKKIGEILAKHETERQKILAEQLRFAKSNKKPSPGSRSERTLTRLDQKKESDINKILRPTQRDKLAEKQRLEAEKKKFEAENFHLGDNLWRGRVGNYFVPTPLRTFRGGESMARAAQEAALRPIDGIQFVVTNRGQKAIKSANFVVEFFDEKKVRVETGRASIRDLDPGKSEEVVIRTARPHKTVEIKLAGKLVIAEPKN